ncbi:Undecaprenyl-phosphate 4-deoxy-4-formamido-L-arabinose transferase [Emticicia aquatica]|uniref:Undecaprenyl-phosphate 4-deoxy-4-formamido-L-arabinose transferase n=1 Tax=Emticicia aquatica TaxID=1681835 RepID=A0ABM9AVC1_9BACT|nr:glycosyltransferase family A protein [Emticicia aquatica]CAH0997924.1 Undecaprenyl-phosphate 4-deoxy-4-formamido-L-arabinose transferase [Emticicia aquatica]
MSKLNISVIIPVYNAELYIKECIDSVLNQTLPPQEIIVINDGSSDNSFSILQSYGHKINLFNQENKGLAATLNAGIKYAKNEWITFLDADDYWHPQNLAWKNEFYQANPDTLICFAWLKQFISPEQSDEVKAGIFCPTEAEKGWVKPTMIVHRSIFEKVCYFNESLRLGDFIEWFSKVQEHGIKYDIINKVVLYRRLHRKSLSNDVRSQTDFVKLLKAKIDRQRLQNK